MRQGKYDDVALGAFGILRQDYVIWQPQFPLFLRAERESIANHAPPSLALSAGILIRHAAVPPVPCGRLMLVAANDLE